jgi:hypothetical protein
MYDFFYSGDRKMQYCAWIPRMVCFSRGDPLSQPQDKQAPVIAGPKDRYGFDAPTIDV